MKKKNNDKKADNRLPTLVSRKFSLLSADAVRKNIYNYDVGWGFLQPHP